MQCYIRIISSVCRRLCFDKYSFPKEIYQVEESIRICKYNIENQERQLQEFNKKASEMQSKLADIKSLSSAEKENLIIIDNKLKYYINLKKALIIEFQGSLKLYEKKLEFLKSKGICNTLESGLNE